MIGFFPGYGLWNESRHGLWNHLVEIEEIEEDD